MPNFKVTGSNNALYHDIAHFYLNAHCTYQYIWLKQYTMRTVSLKKQMTTFLLGTYTLSWFLFLIGHATDFLLLILLGIWAPSITSVVLNRYYYGSAGLKTFLSRFKRSQAKWYYWLLLLFLPAAIHFTGQTLWQLFYYGEVFSFISPTQYWFSAIISSFLIAGLGEELGWRGFLLPRLQRQFSPLKATFVLALVHMLWHLPTYWLGQGMHNVPLLYVLAFLVPWTIIFVWLYNKSGGSLIFAVGFHTFSNASLSIVRFMPSDAEVPIVPGLISQTSLPTQLSGPYLTVCAVYACVAFLIIWKGKFNEVNSDLP